MGKPNHHAAYRIIGGDLKEVPPPLVRMFPGPRRRRVRVSIDRYDGIGVHWYVSIEEEPNPLWDSNEDAWREAYDDPGRAGKSFHGRLGSRSGAYEWVKRTCLANFGPKTHEVSNCTRVPKWFYREGD